MDIPGIDHLYSTVNESDARHCFHNLEIAPGASASLIPQDGADLPFVRAPQDAGCEVLRTSVVPSSNSNGAGMALEPRHFEALAEVNTQISC